MRSPRVLVPGLLLIALGCGGGGGGDGDGEVTEWISVAADRWGTVTSLEHVYDYLVDVGDYHTEGVSQGIRGFYGFDITSIPPGATILEARLVLSVIYTQGDPFAALGNLWVDHVDVGATLDGGDYARTAVTAALDHLDGHPGDAPFALDVTAGVREDVRVGWATSDFRLAFSLAHDGDSTSEFVRFPDRNAGADHVRLEVRYLP